MPSKPGENRSDSLGEFESRSVRTRDKVEGFHPLQSSQILPRFTLGYEEGGRTCFISFRKLLFFD